MPSDTQHTVATAALMNTRESRRKEEKRLYVANRAHEREFCATRVMVDPEFARTLPPMGAPVRAETTLPADPGRWPPLLLRGRDERRADDDA
jgi:hypothetical protein